MAKKVSSKKSGKVVSKKKATSKKDVIGKLKKGEVSISHGGKVYDRGDQVAYQIGDDVIWFPAEKIREDGKELVMEKWLAELRRVG